MDLVTYGRKAALAPLLCSAALWITPLQGAELLGVSGGSVVSIDTSTGTSTLVGASGLANPSALATAPSGQIFTVDLSSLGGVFTLDTINPATGAATTGPTVTGLGTAASGFGVGGLAFSASGTLFAATVNADTSSSLYTINTSTGVPTLIGAIGTGTVCCVTDIAFSPSGTLYGWNSGANFGLLTINTSTGAATAVHPVASPLSIVALSFDASGNLYGVQTNFTESSLYLINPGTGATTLIGSTGSVGAFAVWGIAFTNSPPPAAFFTGQVSLGSGVEYLKFPDNTVFGYYSLVASTIFYHYDMGYEAFVPGSASDVYLYDFMSGHWWYTSNTLFPYLYDFTLNAWVYYFPNTTSPGHYTTNPRYFSNLTTGNIFTM